ncbi:MULTISPECIES: M23 family metallopeptidase [unclassified Sphingobium]|uniref:M23 family metallopeptidase n=1 Tax=unclassified Sphingobium TaxID=2611147 RepID=UPI002225583D|nr:MULTISPECIES: M23 family metallopeptidase [unclassified Sphingobium]MCW2382757.1 murein DD-endopeptidase MepM/ murein hydrolase activator NlpD [Sphingobium sp. B2D3B]MCW2397070.1 murein DD-endopeptidase MepM/ murein hydrolase activator NlpD [Sphingobium sp. B2D3C]
MIDSSAMTFAKEGVLKSAAKVLAIAGLMVASPALADAGHDAQFASLFSAMVQMEQSTEQSTDSKASIPSRQPVDDVRLTSSFGTRSDPFNGRARMHQGIDIPGPIGTPIYATADGVVRRSQWVNGYGNLVEINHGNGLETRYGHMSKLIAQPNERVRRGQLIGLMGSTGRSTGSHLHYEVRIAGSAVNPMPYLEGTNYELALAEAKEHSDRQVAMGGPEANRPTDNRDR